MAVSLTAAVLPEVLAVSAIPPLHEIEVRVRYQETDGQGHVHHANYLTYFELGRTELLRAGGRAYQELEAEGLALVVTEMRCRYLRPARFGDLLLVRTRTTGAKGVRVYHSYSVHCDGEPIAEAESVVACIDRRGKPRRLPDWLLSSGHASEKPTCLSELKE